jgi:hypothetical protein
MIQKRAWKVDKKKLSQKYRTDVGWLIRAWKNGFSDLEITSKTGIKPSTLFLIKQDIELAHRHYRLAQKNQAQSPGDQYQIFFNPHLQ